MSITMTKKWIKRKLAIALLLPLLTSCATYKNGFSCGDAKGANCMSMDRVDRMISSGEIELFNENVRDTSKKCRGKKCYANNSQTSIKLADEEPMQAYYSASEELDKEYADIEIDEHVKY